MNTLLYVFYVSIPYAVVVFAALLLSFYAVMTLSRPRYLVYPYLAILFTVSANVYGVVGPIFKSVYSLASGKLYFALILWILLVAYLWSRLSAAFARHTPITTNLTPWFAAWALLLVGHVATAFMLDAPVRDAMAPMGFSNVVWMWCLIAFVLVSFRSVSDLTELERFIVLVGLGRAIYGLVRWAAFDGDPANAYANRLGLDIKLTYFDINDSLLCFLALTISAMRLYRSGGAQQTKFWRAIYWLTLIAAAACIVLSFRRTAWIGLFLGGLILLTQLPVRQRIQAFVLAVPMALVAISYGVWKRFSQAKGGLEAVVGDFQGSRLGEESARALELKLAWLDFLSNPIAGIGAWGRYSHYQLISWQVGEDAGGFLHSGVLHVALKTGLIGLILFVGMYWVFFRFIWRHRGLVGEAARPLFIAGASGIAFMLPDMLIGTPITQMRTMQMTALCFALPYLAYGLSMRSMGSQESVVRLDSNLQPVSATPHNSASVTA